ncbi:MAG: hypothetical protein ABSF61_02545 [Anaerolineales bacterium]|jgi:hypothetical protein
MASMTKSKLPITFFGSLAVLALLSCGILNTAVNSAVNSAVNKATGNQAVTVSQLWPDVPPFPGAAKANIDLPPALNLMIQGFLSGVYSQSAQGGSKVNSLSFVAFTSSKSPDDVGSFYTVDRMTSAGWNSDSQPGCGTTDTGTPVAAGGFAGTYCLFGKTQGQNVTAIAVIAIADQQSGKTQIYYIREEGTSSQGTATS